MLAAISARPPAEPKPSPARCRRRRRRLSLSLDRRRRLLLVLLLFLLLFLSILLLFLLFLLLLLFSSPRPPHSPTSLRGLSLASAPAMSLPQPLTFPPRFSHWERESTRERMRMLTSPEDRPEQALRTRDSGAWSRALGHAHTP